MKHKGLLLNDQHNVVRMVTHLVKKSELIQSSSQDVLHAIFHDLTVQFITL
jgi:hypothetical protein